LLIAVERVVSGSAEEFSLDPDLLLDFALLHHAEVLLPGIADGLLAGLAPLLDPKNIALKSLLLGFEIDSPRVALLAGEGESALPLAEFDAAVVLGHKVLDRLEDLGAIVAETVFLELVVLLVTALAQDFLLLGAMLCLSLALVAAKNQKLFSYNWGKIASVSCIA